MKRSNLVRGVYVAGGLLLCLGIVFVVGAAIGYDGFCGGFFPGLSARRACSFWAYMSGDVLVIAMILMLTFWPLVLAMLILPPVVGYWFDRRGKSGAS